MEVRLSLISRLYKDTIDGLKLNCFDVAALGALSALKVREHLLAQEDHAWHSALEEIREYEPEEA